MRNLFLSGLFLFLLATCSSTKNQKNNATTTIAEPVVCPVFSFGTGPCFGYCPIFEINVDTNGVAQLIGKRFTYPSGIFTDTMSNAQMAQLYHYVNLISWDTVPERYESRIADAQTYFFQSGDSTQTVGTFDMPTAFDSLRQFFFEMEKSLDWQESENDMYEKIAQNDGAFVHFLEEINIDEFRKDKPFLDNARFTMIDENKHLYMVNTFNTNLDYDGLKNHLTQLNLVDKVEPIYQLKKKQSIIQGSIEK